MDYIPNTERHYRLIDTMGRVRAYAYERADFGPIPADWVIRLHGAQRMTKAEYLEGVRMAQ